MPGNWITEEQVKIYMKARSEGHTQEVSAAKSGMSERTGRSIEQGKRTENGEHSRGLKKGLFFCSSTILDVWVYQILRSSKTQ